MINSLGNRSNVRQDVQNQRGRGGAKAAEDFSAVLEAAKKQKNSDTRNVERLDSIVFESKFKQTQTNSINGASNAETTEEVQFTGSNQQRLEQIHKLNAETDWSSMSDVEKVKTFEERYRKAFGDEKIFLAGGLYMEYSQEYSDIYNDYAEQIEVYFDKGKLAELETTYMQCYKEVYYGGQTDEEVRASIQERWTESGSLEDKYIMLAEYMRCGVDTGVEDELKNEIRMTILKAALEKVGSHAKTGISPMNHPGYGQAYMAYAKGTGDGAGFTVSWNQLVESMMLQYKDAIDMSSHEKAYTEEQLNAIRNTLDEFLKSLTEEI